MPRHPDIGWEHGRMIGGHRHHVQCNYCHRTMIGGITRFKKHLASRRGEIKGCEAVPEEVRETIKKHLAALKPRKGIGKKQKRTIFAVPLSTNQDMESDASDDDVMNDKQTLLTFHDGEAHSLEAVDSQFSVGMKELYDTYSGGACKDEEGLAPPRATDLGWAHGMMVNGDRQKIKCRYCHKVILGGGISRLKQHLAGERGNIAPCEKVPDDVKSQIQQHIGFKVMEKLKRQKESEKARSSIQYNSEEICDDIPSVTSTRGFSSKRRGKEVDEGSSNKRRRRNKKLFVPQVSPATQSTMQLAFTSQESIEQADIAVAKFVYDAGIPFIAANSYYFQRMADAIAAVGPGYRMPSYHSLRNKLLNKCVREVGEICKDIRKSWELTGCTVMVDRWVDKIGWVVINFFVYCPKGTVLLKSVDASDIENCSEDLLSLFDGIVQEIGPGNIVNFVTDTTPCYKAAGRELMNKYKTFFWSICANHGIELMLKSLGEIDEVKEVLAKAKRICQFIYNNAWALNLMRKKTDGIDIFQLAMTEFVTKFLTLDNMVSLKDSLLQMFTSTQWQQSTFSKQRVGTEIAETVLDSQFWSSCATVVKVSKPLVTAIHIMDSEERPSMGYLYDALEKAKKSIILAFDNNESEYLPYLEIIDRARNEFHSPLHTAAYYLNPSVYYNPSFSTSNVIQKGLLDCIETLEPNLTAQDNITKHKAFYEDAVGDFSRPVALRGRETLPPATWWSLYASDYPELQRLALRILSQTCNITVCERNHTMKECVHSSKNKLEHERSSDLTYVHYNLRLQQRQLVASGSRALGRGECDPTSLEGRNDSTGEWIKDPKVLEGEDNSWMDVALPSDVDDSLAVSVGNETSHRSDDIVDSSNFPVCKSEDHE